MKCTCELWKSFLIWLKSYDQGWSFWKVESRSRSLGQNMIYAKGLVTCTRYTHVKYEIPILYCSEVMTKVKVLPTDENDDAWGMTVVLGYSLQKTKKLPGVYLWAGDIQLTRTEAIELLMALLHYAVTCFYVSPTPGARRRDTPFVHLISPIGNNPKGFYEILKDCY